MDEQLCTIACIMKVTFRTTQIMDRFGRLSHNDKEHPHFRNVHDRNIIIRTSHSLESLDYKFIEDNLQTEWVFSMNEEGAAD